MNSKKVKETHIALLRGINVGGHHKVPMADLRTTLEKLGFENIVTLLNSGNVIFNSLPKDTASLEELISGTLERTFGFPVPTMVRTSHSMYRLFQDGPFKGITMHKDIRLYVSFLKENSQTSLELPWKSPDSSYQIIGKNDKIILSVLDLSKAKTPKAMIALEKFFGTDITTRNWKTIERIGKKLDANH
jgi:uncharacterized protein (DUF1697 family)